MFDNEIDVAIAFLKDMEIQQIQPEVRWVGVDGRFQWPIIVENEICIIGDGGNINVWQEKWINGSIKLIDVIPHIPSNFLNLRVKDLTDLNGESDITLLNSL